MKKEVIVVKIGGNVLEDPQRCQTFLETFAQLPSPKVLVHGGGKTASALSERMGIKPNMVNGRRITDADTLEVVTMVYAGLANKNVVAQLQALGCNALGLSGADGNSIRAVKRPKGQIDYGFAGDIKEVNCCGIGSLIAGGFVPVFCALTHDGKGQLLNTNADTIASEIAISLGEGYSVKLYYCFEKNGVLNDIEDDDSVIRDINPKKYEKLVMQGKIAAGMIPKMDNSFHALAHGVSEVAIGHVRSLQNPIQPYTKLSLHS